ncbi:Uncharacterized protein TC_0708 [Durusdinium trenchii]
MGATLLGGMRVESSLTEHQPKLKLYWGDLHNHNAVGYGKGSLPRSIDNAREHLDFFAFTGHASWHDLPQMPQNRHQKWIDGFKVHREHWPRTRKLIREANTDDFVAILGYEWHSSQFGDYCMLFPEDQPDLYLPDHVEKLLDFAEDRGALAIPHHVAYKEGWRGANFAHFREATTPFVEIFSEHGCSMTDRSPYPYIRHSMSGRDTANTIHQQMQRGLKFGFVASTDDHQGFPGAYGMGVVGVWAEDLSAESLFTAFRQRRTYAATGDRIALEVALNGQPMGSHLEAVADRQFDVRVEGFDALASVELIRNGRVIERHFPEDDVQGLASLPGRAKCRVQYGWGPWGQLDLSKICDWDLSLRIEGGRFVQAWSCFQSSPFDEGRRDTMRAVDDREIRLSSATARQGSFAEDPTKGVVCDVEASPEAVFVLELRKPVAKTYRIPVAELIATNRVEFVGEFTSESFIVHRLASPEETGTTVRWLDRRRVEDGPDWYYVRAVQHNGQLAWCRTQAVVMVRRVWAFALLLLTCAGTVSAEGVSTAEPAVSFHLTSRPWKPSGVARQDYLETVEGLCRFAARHQDERGAFVDPFLGREHQYSTPYFAYAVGVLVDAGKAKDLLPHGTRAMEYATACFAEGAAGIPEEHGEFFLAPLAGALEHYAAHVDSATLERWTQRLRQPRAKVLQDGGARNNNWRTYAMRGEWARAKAGLIPEEDAREFIEWAWLRGTQRERIAEDRMNFYQDWSSDPQSHAVEAVGRGNLLALIAGGYDGASVDEMVEVIERGTRMTLLWQDPTGQCPPNGRTDDHVFNDVLYQLAFEVLAELARERGDVQLAAQARRAARLSFKSIDRWRREDGEWRGSFFVTKNHFDPTERVGYQPASQYSNYNGAVMLHLAEAYETVRAEIEEQPAPCEIGGYAVEADAAFGSLVANAGGMQLQLNLRGDSVPKYGKYWTPLGLVRFSRVEWDSRLGPSDGVREKRSAGSAVSFGPTWKQGNRWVRLADLPEHYRGTWTTTFCHPLLVKGQVLYHSVTGAGGPIFRQELVITPDGVLTTLTCDDARHEFGLTVPLLENDGRPLVTNTEPPILSTRYPRDGDQQCFLCLDPGVEASAEPSLRSSYGDLRPVRVSSTDNKVTVFVYPRSADDPAASDVYDSFRTEDDAFRSVLGQVDGTLYFGRYSAGGYGNSLDLDGDGQPELRLSDACGFIVQLSSGRITAVEVDRPVSAGMDEKEIQLEAFEPVTVSSE